MVHVRKNTYVANALGRVLQRTQLLWSRARGHVCGRQVVDDGYKDRRGWIQI